MFSDVVQCLSVLFAAIAAAGALLTVLLSLRQSEDDSIRRLVEALIGIWKAASDIRRAAGDGDASPSLFTALDEALVALPRAVALRPPILPVVGDRLDRLYDRDQALRDPDKTEEDAAEAVNAIRRSTPPSVWRLGLRAVRPRPAAPAS